MHRRERTATLTAAFEGRWLAILGLYHLRLGLLTYALFDFLLED